MNEIFDDITYGGINVVNFAHFVFIFNGVNLRLRRFGTKFSKIFAVKISNVLSEQIIGFIPVQTSSNRYQAVGQEIL